MYVLHKPFFLLSMLSLCLLLTACDPDIPDNQYSMEECKEELLDASDYEKEAGIDKILVVKKERKMYLYKDGEVQQTIPISLGKNPIGKKQKKGDKKTPEGEFFIDRKLCSKKYYRSLCISYPGPKDKQKAKRLGIDPGGDITIHAQPKWNADGNGDTYTLSKDWTEGCMAVTNDAMNDLWYAVREGVPIVIR